MTKRTKDQVVPNLNTQQHDQFQKQVTNLCDLLGLAWFHVPDSRRMRAGLPDLIIVGIGGVIYAEIKTGAGQLNSAQRKIIHLLRQSHQRVHTWRPGNLKSGAIYATLLEITKAPSL